jgi:carboxypeptidase Taq
MSPENPSASRAELRLYELWGEIRDLGAAYDLLDWDQETFMPEGGLATRGKVGATLAGLKHRLLTAPELGEVLEACAAEAAPGSVLAAQVRQARYDVDQAVKIPESLAKALAEARSRGTGAWQKARAAADFSLFEKELSELVSLRKEQAACLLPGGRAYDAMLDVYERGSTEAALEPLFASLVAELKPLVQAVVDSGRKIDEAGVRGFFAKDAQCELGLHASAGFGFDFGRGRLDVSAHPFCMGLSSGDVRMTWRLEENDFRPALYGVLHETGHGLYEQGLPAKWDRTPLGDSASLGIHESQSRLWENQVGRSRGFWRWLAPKFKQCFPNHPYDWQEIWPALHTIEPSLIRVEADEGTYNLHIALRFELERRLLSGDLSVAELPGAWDDLYQDYLGVRADNAADGVLQDIHWSQGMFGYFPTYTLGTMTAAQLAKAAAAELGDLDELFAAGEMSRLLSWLRSNIHRHGAFHSAAELVEKATGRPLEAKDLLEDLRRNAAENYGIAG